MKRINKYFAMFSALLLILTSLLSVAPVFAAEMGNITKTVTLHNTKLFKHPIIWLSQISQE